ncbi:MAG: Nif3-like dinuclear metal center hexameric protein [Bacteroidetes bacterium]|nr:Nif3-like dinuclear metal center hexameric protein [Bacteroidota bacterium]
MSAILVKDIIETIESFAPAGLQESYDNSGLQVGNLSAVVTKALLTLDVTEAVVEEAIAVGANMIIAHHPLLFSGLKRISGRNYVERIVQRAIKNDINIYAAHTNLDNIYNGVNAKIAEKLGLQQTRILAPVTGNLFKLYTTVPHDAASKVRDALFAAGAGSLGNYTECSFNLSGTGTYRPNEDADPAIGKPGGSRESVEEVRLEVLIEKHQERKVLSALFEHHPYEEIAYEVVALQNPNQETGAGMVGLLPEPMEAGRFLGYVKEKMNVSCIRHTELVKNTISKVAICGGSGSFLLKNAISAAADVFITGDFKYHQFFDAEGKIIIADIGHFESEQFTVEIFRDLLNKKFPNFAVLVSNINTNPVKYFY